MPFPNRLLSRAAAIVVIAAGLSALPMSAQAATPRSTPDTGLFGASDPTYDGVVRQSYAIVGLVAARVDVPKSAIDWLVTQQCPDGSFMAYRNGDCTPADLQSYTGPDTNSTAAAAIALASVGRLARAKDAARWLAGIDNSDGGWPWMSGLASDPVSTGMVLQALHTVLPASRDISSGTRWVRASIKDCSNQDGTVGGMPYSSGGSPDSLSSVEALAGVSGALPLAHQPSRAATPVFSCERATPARLMLARYTAQALLANNGILPGMAGGAGWNETALAVIALQSSGVGGRASALAMSRLMRHIDDYVGIGADANPAALGTLIVAATSAGASPRAFGPRDADLVKRLLATRRR